MKRCCVKFRAVAGICVAAVLIAAFALAVASAEAVLIAAVFAAFALLVASDAAALIALD